MELNQLLQQINSRGTIDLNKSFERAIRRSKNEQTEADEQEERIIREKIKKAAELRKPINFFNKHTLKLMSKTPSEILCELGVRAFTGSRDVPKDEAKAYGLFDFAAQNAIAEKNDKVGLKKYEDVQYYHNVIRKFQINTVLATDPADKSKLENDLLKTIEELIRLADGGHPLACFSYGKEVFDNLRDGGYNYLDIN